MQWDSKRQERATNAGIIFCYRSHPEMERIDQTANTHPRDLSAPKRRTQYCIQTHKNSSIDTAVETAHVRYKILFVIAGILGVYRVCNPNIQIRAFIQLRRWQKMLAKIPRRWQTTRCQRMCLPASKPIYGILRETGLVYDRFP